MSNRQLVFRIAVVLALLAPTYGVKAFGAPAQGLQTADQTVRINLGAVPTTLDPSVASDTASVQVIAQLFAGLTRQDEQSGAILPDMASSWTVASNGMSITFNLRPGLQWSDGAPLTASDVVFGLNRARQNSPYNFVFDQVGLTNVAAQSSTGVRIDLSRPNGGVLPSIMAEFFAFPIPEHAVNAFGQAWANVSRIVSSGPYRSAGSSLRPLVLEKNPLYHDAGAVSIERIEFYAYSDAVTATQRYASGSLDVTSTYDASMVTADPLLRADLHGTNTACNYYYGFTTTKPPMDNPLVRKALIAAVDRAGLYAGAGIGGIPAATFAPPGVFGAVPAGSGVGIDYNPAQAQAWLAQSGVALPLTIKLAYNTSPAHAAIAQYIANSWEANLGIDVVTEDRPWQDYLAWLNPATPVEEMPHVWRMSWCADYLDQHNWVYEVFNSQVSLNRIRWHNAEFDTITSQAAASGDPAQRTTWYRRAEQILNQEQAGILSLFWSGRFELSKPYLQRTFSRGWAEHIRNWSFLPGSGTATPAGGSVESVDGRTEATFPAGAFSTNVDLVLDHLTVLPGSAGRMVSTNRTFQLSALDATTGAPVAPDAAHPPVIMMQYTDSEKGSIVESTLRLYSWNGSGWQQENATFDYANNTVSAPVTHLGTFALVGETNRIWLPTLAFHTP